MATGELSQSLNTDINTILEREESNNMRTAYLYFDANNNSWVAFGYSAYSLRLLAKSHSYDSIRGFSVILGQPITMIAGEMLKKLRPLVTIVEEESGNYVCFTVKKSFNVNEYKEWAMRLNETVSEEQILIQTRVSEYVPKDAYIVDNMSSLSRNTKRVIDFCVASVLIVIFAPLMLIVHFLVRREDHGPSIYKQERIGRFGRPFYIYKFRSMRLDAEADGPQLATGGYSDPRLTKIGKFIKSHHLDELPQLFNVWMGDMAFVGPRPERKFFIDQILEHDQRYTYLYQIRPGVTSYATMYNGYTDTMEKMLKRLEYDLYYLGHRTLFFDAKILWMTFCSIALGKKF